LNRLFLHEQVIEIFKINRVKSTFYFLIIILFLSSCSVNKKPIFIKVDNIEVLQYAMDTIKLTADAFFENPNSVSGKISTDSIFVYMNNKKLARVSSKEFKVPAKKEFAIPMLVEIPTKQFLESNKNGLLSGILNSVLNKSIKIQFKGDLKYKVLGFSRIYTIDQTQEIKL